MDPEETNRWFAGWTDQDYRLPKHEDIVIYEMHVRDMTKHPSSHVGKSIAGKYEGLIASEGSGAALDHLKSLGVNVIELMPVQEFANGEDRYDWGYGPGFYFAPEASYGRQPLKGSQFYEFKNLVNELHNRGFGVIVDVVYNHVGGVNVFNLIDRRYHFRFNPDFSPSNFSGCGNDVRTEAPMMRRLIVDSVVHWMKEFHVDGFRFDLAELIDMETMMAIRDAARAVNPDVLLISEPWSFRGENKRELTGTGWSAWNNDFRYAAKDFVQGKRNRDWLQKCITGSVEIWAANPLQPINYVESHDDMALADELCTRPDRDGRHLQENDVAANRLAATVLFTSLGIPMMNAGQEFVRSKRGISNTYDRGDAINAIDWNDRSRPLAAETLNYYTDLLRLRLSSEGAAFRASERPPHGYYRWILPQDQQSLGYIVNVPRVHGGAGFIVLLNSGGDASEFNVPFPAGRWRLIGNGRLIQIEGLADEPDVEGPKERVVRVPPMSSYIFINE
jgi:pullulanase/glycogen debranching enzyme